MSTYRIVQAGDSRSFPTSHPFIERASAQGDSHVFIGNAAGRAFKSAGDLDACPFVAIELGQECLGVHTGESRGHEGSNAVGFARFRLGSGDPTALVELVCQPQTRESVIAAARAAFEAAGLKVAVCGDFPGRIVNRLIRPYLNAALRRLDEKLASAEDMDKTLCLGLGYPEGPIALLERTGLADHHDVTLALFRALGQEAYAPARRAQVAKARAD
jgi:3-hydroxybutyryl-CoA dehydrogenase